MCVGSFVSAGIPALQHTVSTRASMCSLFGLSPLLLAGLPSPRLPGALQVSAHNESLLRFGATPNWHFLKLTEHQKFLLPIATSFQVLLISAFLLPRNKAVDVLSLWIGEIFKNLAIPLLITAQRPGGRSQIPQPELRGRFLITKSLDINPSLTDRAITSR